MKLDRKKITSFSSFHEADEADRKERWSMSQIERLELIETLRRYLYPNGTSAPRLQRIFNSSKQTRS